jgi:hypothetical protein
MQAEREEALRLWEAEQQTLAPLRAARLAAQERLIAHPEAIRTVYGDDDLQVPERCAKTGVVLLESDEIIEDVETGEVWLRSALGLPPRPEQADGEGIEEAA